jgi:hypothetical protein
LPAGANAPGGEHRCRRDGVDHFGPQDDAADLAGVAAALVALRNDDVDPGGLVRPRMFGRAAQRRHQPAGIVNLLDHIGRWRPQRVGDELDLAVLQRHLDLRRGGRRRPAKQLVHRMVAFGQPRDAVVGEDLVGEAAVLLRNRRQQLLLELFRVDLTHALVLAGDDDIDAVGLVSDVVVDPFELDFELVGGEADGAQHTEAAGAADCRHHVAAVAEGKDGELDPQLVAEFSTHLRCPSDLVACTRPLISLKVFLPRTIRSIRAQGQAPRVGDKIP